MYEKQTQYILSMYTHQVFIFLSFQSYIAHCNILYRHDFSSHLCTE